MKSSFSKSGFSGCETRFRGVGARRSERGARCLVGALIVMCAQLGASLAAAAAGLSVAESASRPIQWTFEYAGKTVMVYAFDPQRFKPYVKVLNTLDGDGVLRDSPQDHLHHHALMYGITVNAINFWEETAGCGVQKVVESPRPVIEETTQGQPQARLTQLIYWVAPQDAFLPNTNTRPLLVERRTLRLTLDPGKRETALHWQSAFEVGTGTNVVTLSGANYHGLGMRFLQELDRVAVHLAPGGSLELSNSRQDVSQHPWEAVLFDRPARPATVALFGSPSNERGDGHYFAMKTPFAYLSSTQNLDREPLIYHQGQHFELNFLITLYPELKTAEALAERNRQWRRISR